MCLIVFVLMFSVHQLVAWMGAGGYVDPVEDRFQGGGF